MKEIKDYKQARRIMKRHDRQIMETVAGAKGVAVRKEGDRWVMEILVGEMMASQSWLGELDVEGLPVRIRKVGEIKPVLLRTDKWRPAPGGVSIGHFQITAGTLGCSVLKAGQKYILSNNHVLANCNNAALQDPIYQPGPHDGGQAADMLSEGSGGDSEMLEYIHANKTAKLIRASCRMGALTGGASEEQLEALGVYGQAVGLAFQVIDDLLDAGGDAELVGKAVGKDDGAGKLTYPSIVGVEAAREKVGCLVEEANGAVKVLGKRGERLAELAELLARRVR